MVKGKIYHIYGNEIGSILGVNKNKNIMEVYLEKLQKKVENQENIKKRHEAMYWVNTLKEIMCKEFTIRSGRKVRKEFNAIVDEEYDFMKCKVDRRIVGENSILLCNLENEVNISNELNKNILLECQHNMRVAKAEKCYVASLINNERFIFKEIMRDENLINKIIKEEKDFIHNHILKQIPPGQVVI